MSSFTRKKSPLTPSYSDIDPIRTHRIREVKKREGATSQEHAFYGRKFSCRGNARRPSNYSDRHQGPNYRVWILQNTASREKVGDSFLAEPASHRNGCIIDQVDLENLPWERETLGFWLDIPESLLQLFISQEVNPAGAERSDVFLSVVVYRVRGFQRQYIPLSTPC